MLTLYIQTSNHLFMWSSQ